jgi:UDP-N-acetylmuramyl pentapeptide phosphotransferase/UDP-N-acetylglucosamine-1-phosphate transferase
MPGTEGILLIVGSGLLAAVLTGVAISACRVFGIVADRSDRVQCVHRHWAPRVGGLPLYVAVTVGILAWTDLPDRHLALLLMVCALPAFIAGFIEDLWDRVGPKARLWATFVSAWLAWFLLDGRLTHVDLPGLDYLLSHYWPVAFLFTAFAVGGVAHSINIIDGFNGLSTFTCVIAFAAFFIVATVVGDPLIQGVSLLFCGTLLGFLAWNFPFGRIFLGDAGAYFLGFALGELSVLLVARNPEVSPWFCFLLLAYPIWDTLFSSYRREIKRRVSWSSPDALHLHHLIYRRLVRPYGPDTPSDPVLANSMTSLYVWVLGFLCAAPAVLFWDSPAILCAFAVLFCVTYGVLYRRLAKFRAPRLLQMPLRRGLPSIESPMPADSGDITASIK